MAQHDYNLANQTGAGLRADLNNALAAISSNNSGAAAPSTTFAYQFWADTATGLLKVRNAANSAWVAVGSLSAANLGLAALASPAFTGTPTAPTAAAGTSTTQVATTAFVASYANGVSMGVQNSNTGTSINFPGIPSTAKRITVMLNAVSTNGASVVLIRVGSGSAQSTGYNSITTSVSSGGATVATSTSGFVVVGSSSTGSRFGSMVLTQLSGNTWVAEGGFYEASTGFHGNIAGAVAVSGVLDRVSVATTNGTDTFDAGSINVLYE